MGTFDERSAELSLEPLRRLAHALVLEKSSADDVVQEAWLAALQARGGEIRGLGSWLAGTARRLARNRSRAEHRRDARERRAARPEHEPSAVESTARIEILREVLTAVDRLPQPYRDAVVLRYLDDLPPREIARRLDVPVNTARTHVRRGIERLRADLDARPGRDREAFLAALLPLLGPGAGSARPTANPHVRSSRRIVMQHPIAIAVSVLGLVGAGWLWQHRSEADAPSEAVEVAAAPLDAEAVPVDAELAPAAPRAGPEAPAPVARAGANEGWTLRGYAYNAGGAELVGRIYAGARAEGTPLLEQRFRAEANGTFAWTLSPPTTFVTVEVSGDRTTHRGRPYRGRFVPGDPASETALLSLYPLDVTLRGNVVDADGAPVAGASVALDLGDEARSVISAGDGSFALPWTSKYTGWQAVGAWLAGYAPGAVSIDRSAPAGEGRYELRLVPELRLHGTVRDRDGNPVEGASVSAQGHGPTTLVKVGGSGPVETQQTSPTATLGGEWPTVRTDSQGRWDLGGIHPEAGLLRLTARAPGYRPEELALFQPAGATQRSHGFVLTRGVTITGRVRANGAPVWGAYIGVGDYAGEIEDVDAWTDAEGRFTLENVPSGRQHLWIWRRDLAQLRHDVTVSEGLPELELELAPDHHVAGVLLDAKGEPLPWAYVMAEDPSGAQPPRFLVGDNTNAEGRFLLRCIPEGRVAVSVGSFSLEVELGRDDLVIRLPPPQERPPSPPLSGGVVKLGSGTRPPPTQETALAAEPVVAVTESSGSARIDGRLAASAADALEGQEIELAAVEASVAAGPWGARTDARGAFSFEGLPAGTFELRWLRREGELETVDLETRVTLAADEARIEDLRPRGKTTVRGRLEFMEIPGRPASNSTVQMPSLIAISLSRVQGRSTLPGRRGAFARDGVFELEGLEPGDWAVEAQIVFDESTRTVSVFERDVVSTTSSVMSRIRVPAEGVSEVVISVVRP